MKLHQAHTYIYTSVSFCERTGFVFKATNKLKLIKPCHFPLPAKLLNDMSVFPKYIYTCIHKCTHKIYTIHARHNFLFFRWRFTFQKHHFIRLLYSTRLNSVSKNLIIVPFIQHMKQADIHFTLAFCFSRQSALLSIQLAS